MNSFWRKSIVIGLFGLLSVLPAAADDISKKSGPRLLPDGPGDTPPLPKAQFSIPYALISPPHPYQSTAVIGVLTDSPDRTAAVARYVADQHRKASPNKWANMQVFVFTVPEQAKRFNIIQHRRKGAPLTAVEFRKLDTAWATVPTVLDRRGKIDRVYSPNRAPFTWWRPLIAKKA